MVIIKVTKFKTPQYGENAPDIEVTRTQFLPDSAKKGKREEGVTKQEFFDILDKASKPKSDEEQTQT